MNYHHKQKIIRHRHSVMNLVVDFRAQSFGDEGLYLMRKDKLIAIPD
jgi:hypothetical protein